MTLKIQYLPLADIQQWERNPKKHDLPGIIASLRRYGFQLLPKFDATLNGLVFGNGRIEALRLMHSEGEAPPKGIAVDESGAWAVPILFGNDLASQAAAEAFALDHNNLVLSGGGFSAVYTSQIWHEGDYVKLLVELNQTEQLPVTVQSADVALLLKMIFGEQGNKAEKTHTRVTIGMYVQKIPLPAYFAWAEALSQQLNFDKEAVITELKTRLGILAVEEKLHATP